MLGNPSLSHLSMKEIQILKKNSCVYGLHVEGPAQRAEKRRLIAVFEGGSIADGAIPAVSTVTVIVVTMVSYTTVM